MTEIKTFVGKQQIREYRLSYQTSGGLSVLDQVVECARKRVEYRTAGDLFTKIVSRHRTDGTAPYSFEVTTRDGRTSLYARRGQSAVWDAWLLSEVKEPVGNFMKVSWYTDSVVAGAVAYRPRAIRYNYSSTDPWASPDTQVTFHYVTRSDRRSTHDGGRQLRRESRLDKIKTFVGQQQIREYRLGYDVDSTTSVLTHVQECARRRVVPNGTSGPDWEAACRGALAFDYAPVQTGFGGSVSSPENRNVSSRNETTVMDLDGNGEDDVLIRSSAGWYLLFNSTSWHELGSSLLGYHPVVTDYYNTGQDDILALKPDGSDTKHIYYANNTVQVVDDTVVRNQAFERVLGADIDGDGLKDVLHCTNGWWQLRRNLRSGGFATWLEYWPYLFAGDCDDPEVVDLHGNGVEELLYKDLWGGLRVAYYTQTGSVVQARVYGRTGHGWEQLLHGQNVRIDWNADGRPDFIDLRELTPQGRGELFVNLGNRIVDAEDSEEVSFQAGGYDLDLTSLPPGIGFDPAAFKRALVAHHYVLDENGDGKDDIVTRYQNQWLVLRSTSEGFSFAALSLLAGDQKLTLYEASGDGMKDLGYVDAVNETWEGHLRTGPPKPLLGVVREIQGARMAFEYAHLTNSSVYEHSYVNCAHPRNCRRPRHAVVSHHHVWQSVYNESNPELGRRDYAHSYGGGLSD
ncbi:MAG: hypothetical protein MJD61_15760, partial [Proteobacteria bacterium]|nr:hypothetical protein [Pseudomonadota bacterium]